MKFKEILSNIKKFVKSYKKTIWVISALLIAVLLELGLFNFRSFANNYEKTEFDLNSPYVKLTGIEYDESRGVYIAGANSKIMFRFKHEKATDTYPIPDSKPRIYTVYVDVKYNPPLTQEEKEEGKKQDTDNSKSFSLRYSDEQAEINAGSFKTIKNYNRSSYQSPIVLGNVDWFEITINNAGQINNVVLNKNIPIAFNYLRAFIIFVLLAFTVDIARFFARDYNKDSRGQVYSRRILLAGMIILMCWITTTTFARGNGVYEFFANYLSGADNQYSSEMVEAFRKGNLWLDITPSKSLLDSTNPYYDTSHTILGPDGQKINFGIAYDHAFYDGKWYSIWGPLPVLILFLPFKVITGQPLPSVLGNLAFAIGTIVFLYLLWKKFVETYFKRMSFGMFFFGAFTLCFGSFVAFTPFYGYTQQIQHTSGVMFSVLGIYLLLLSHDKGKIKKTVLRMLGCLAMALTVLCRVNQLFNSVFLLAILYAEYMPLIKGKRWKDLSLYVGSVILPYIPVGIVTMWYNHARFGSVFNFGTYYQMTGNDFGARNSRDIVSTVMQWGRGLYYFLFQGADPNVSFPFFKQHGMNTGNFLGYMLVQGGVGMFAYPLICVLFIVPFIWKKMKKEGFAMHRLLVLLLFGLGCAQIMLMMTVADPFVRYEMDFQWYFFFAAVIVCGVIYNMLESASKFSVGFRRACTVIMLFSALMVICVSMADQNNLMERNNPQIFYRIVDFFKFW